MKKEHYIIIILLLVFALLYTCNSQQSNTTITKTVTRVDSVRVTDTVVNTIYVPKKEVVYIDYQIDLTDTSVFKNKVYHYGQSDSLLTYNIYVDSECKPEKVDFQYDIKNFTIHDSIYIKDSVHVKELVNKSFLAFGVHLNGSNNYFGVTPSLTYNRRNKALYTIGYDVLNENIMVGFSKKISFK